MSPDDISIAIEERSKEELLKAQLAAANERIESLVRELKLHREMAIGNYWAWQSDGEDHLESLICPVLIRANYLAAFIARAEKAEAACAAMRDSLRRAVEDGRVIQLEEWQYHAQQALSYDCGKDYVPRAGASDK